LALYVGELYGSSSTSNQASDSNHLPAVWCPDRACTSHYQLSHSPTKQWGL